MLFYFSHNSSIAAPADAEYGRTTKYYEKQTVLTISYNKQLV